MHTPNLRSQSIPGTHCPQGCYAVIVFMWLSFSHSVTSDSFVTPWTVARQDPLSVGSPRQEYCCGLPFPSLEDLPDTGIECVSPELAGRFFTTAPLGSTVKQGVHFPLRMAPSPFPHYLQENNDSLLNVGSLYQSEFAYIDFTKVTPVLLLVLSV